MESKVPPWPKEVPILAASDICRGQLDGPKGTHCLVGWAITTFGAKDTINTPLSAASDAIAKAIAQVKPTDLPRRDFAGPRDIAGFNDSSYVSKALIARAWNLAMAKLGYTVVT